MWSPSKHAQAGAWVLLSQEEARFPLVPTRSRTVGVKGHRPVGGTGDGTPLLSVFAVRNVVTAAVHTTTLDSPADVKRRTGTGKTRRFQGAFADHLRHIGRLYPRGKHLRVVLSIDNAPGHGGEAVTQALADNPPLERYRLPSDSPQLNVIERFWKRLRRRATHHRLCNTLADLKRSIRASLCYFQTMRSRLQSLIAGCYEVP